MRPVQTKISLHIHKVWSKAMLFANKYLIFIMVVTSVNFDQSVWMYLLIQVFAA